MLDRSLLNKKYPPITVEIEKKKVQFFSEVTGQSDPVYLNESAAQKNKYPSLLAPPTFLAIIFSEKDSLYQKVYDLFIDSHAIYHAGQIFKYYAPVFAGDLITMNAQLTDIYEKNNGELQFIEIKSIFINQNKKKIGQSISTFVRKL